MSQISKDAFDYLNKLRQNPKIAIPKIKEQLKYFKGNELHLPGEITLITREGARAWQECINFLEKQHALEPMTWSDHLAKAASDHVQDTGPKGVTGHNGTDGSSMSDRIQRYGQWLSTIGENISYGQKTGEDVIIQLIIDDGVADRGHRTNCFNPDFRTVGISDGKHKTYKTMCVFDFAGGMRDKGQGGHDDFQQANNAKQFKELFGKHSNFDNDDDFQNQFQKMMIQKGNHNHHDNNDEQMPAGCISSNTSTSVSIKNGKKTTTITKTFKFKDGSTQTSVETITEG